MCCPWLHCGGACRRTASGTSPVVRRPTPSRVGYGSGALPMARRALYRDHGGMTSSGGVGAAAGPDVVAADSGRPHARQLAPRRVQREPQDRLLAGVASGLGRHLGVDPMVMRATFVALMLLGGFGGLLYVAFWLLVPVRDPMHDLAPGLASATRRGLRSGGGLHGRDVGLLLSLGALVLGSVVALQNAGQWISPRVFWPLLVAAAGAGLLWWQADERDRAAWLSGRSQWTVWVRMLLGAALLAGAVFLAAFQAGASGALDDAFGAIVLAVLGVAVVLGPWLLRLTHDLRAERAERIRSQERADVAAHLHDSVLQTLALIQRQAGDSAAVTRLARTQERQLRSWLFDSASPADATVAAALREAVADVEAAFPVVVELVAVGDRPLDVPAAAVVAAAREAMVNAAAHSGSDRVDVYCEAGGDMLEVYVRDRGRGFDLDAVPADRLGVRRSILDRIARHSGTAEIHTAPGAGTEVRLSLSRPAAAAGGTP